MVDLAPFDPERSFAALSEHDVEFVLIGALAARVRRFPRLTADADVTSADSAKNLERLAAALRALHARVDTESVPDGLAFDCSGTALARAELWNLITAAGRLGIIRRPAGAAGYAVLRANAVRFEIHGRPLSAASRADILRLKRATDRPQDRQDAMVVHEMVRVDTGMETH